MSLFFFVPGLEIKREILVSELRDPRPSLHIIAAAILQASLIAGISGYLWLRSRG